MLDPQHLARDWQEGWNSHDLSRILAHYTDDIVFRSAKAVALMGTGEIRGKAALRCYWGKALARQPDLHFAVQEVFAGHNMLTLIYTNHRGVRAAETLWFNDEGRAQIAAACHVK